MARPKMRFSPDQAVGLVVDLAARLYDTTFTASHIVGAGLYHGADRVKAAAGALQPLQELVHAASKHRNTEPAPLPDDFPEQVKTWISTYLTEDGWRRYQASRRQTKSHKAARRLAFEERPLPVDMPEAAAWRFGELAEELQLERPQLIHELVEWLHADPKGKAALEQFKAKARHKSLVRGWALLGGVFKVTPEEVRGLLASVAGPDQDRTAEWTLLALKAGKVRLTKLSRALKDLPVQERFAKLVAPLPEGPHRCLLRLAAKGKVDEALASLQPAEAPEHVE